MILLTAITQIGGVLWLVTIIIVAGNKKNKALKRFVGFIILYAICTFLVVPYVAPLMGREKVENTTGVSAHSFWTVALNRNYVRPSLNKLLQYTAQELQKKFPGIKIVYLDASFPFLDGFPLLPHLSHNDGKKIDISFIYKTSNGAITNKKPSISGYGVFVNPENQKSSMTNTCKSKGYFQYDFSKYLSFGTINKDLRLHPEATAFMITRFARDQATGKIFIEPYLKRQMNLYNEKIRFHGCQAVRHDDHLHLQLR
ncbi:hypothetical protein ACJD0Z_06770 [Flavobacteriaceae bacterium M23B6Z8]